MERLGIRPDDDGEGWVLLAIFIVVICFAIGGRYIKIKELEETKAVAKADTTDISKRFLFNYILSYPDSSTWKESK